MHTNIPTQVRMVNGLLPQLLQMLSTKQPGTRKALMDVLSHIIKRFRGNSMELPHAALHSLLCDVSASGFTRNFASVFLEMALSRLSPAAQDAFFPELLCGVAACNAAQQQL